MPTSPVSSTTVPLTTTSLSDAPVAVEADETGSVSYPNDLATSYAFTATAGEAITEYLLW
jgi:hypothetical protein